METTLKAAAAAAVPLQTKHSWEELWPPLSPTIEEKERELHPTDPQTDHFPHILEIKATSHWKMKSRQHLQDVSISHLFSHGMIHLSSWHFFGFSYHLPNPWNHSVVRNTAQLYCFYFPFPPAPPFKFFHRSVKPLQEWLIVMDAKSFFSVYSLAQTRWRLPWSLLLFKLIYLHKKSCSSTAEKEFIKLLILSSWVLPNIFNLRGERNEKPHWLYISVIKITKEMVWSLWQFITISYSLQQPC